MITLIILAITCLVSAIALTNNELQNKLLFYPYGVETNRELYRYFTSGLVHGSWLHLGINMYVLFMFGQTVEKYYGFHFGSIGPYLYLLMYLGSLLISDIPTFFKHRNNPVYRSLGASGAVSGVVFSFILFDPNQSLMFIFLPIPIKAWILGILYLIYSVWAGKRQMDNINHDAHLYGALFGLTFTLALKPSLALDLLKHIGIG